MIDTSRLQNAYDRVRDDLLSERTEQGHWIGELATSALSTATAVSALTLVARNSADLNEKQRQQLDELAAGGIRWLSRQQNEDGGWGDTDKSYSNIATTMLVVSAFHIAGQFEDHRELVAHAEQYIDRQGRLDGLRKRYGRDKTFAVPILTNCALAGLVPWREVSPLPFEAACVPQRLYRFLQLPVVSYAIPALVGIGQARFFHRRPRNPLSHLLRAFAVKPSMKVLERMQPQTGGYLEAVPLTSFVVMSLAATGRADHGVARNGMRFIIDSVRPDGSWPIDTNLATWTTTLSLNAMAAGGEDIATIKCLDWLLSCQNRKVHPFTGAAPGGWGWTDLSGAVPDADDTPGALLSLHYWMKSPSCRDADHDRIKEAAQAGVSWLLDLQNRDGGWPTFCRGWGKLPFDRSGADLTAHAMRAIHVWRDVTDCQRVDRGIDRGFRFLSKRQNADGSWFPLWFGNQDHPEEENPVYGTAKVLAAYRDLNRMEDAPVAGAIRWLVTAQNENGSFGAGTSASSDAPSRQRGSIEETSLAVEALLGGNPHPSSGVQAAAEQGLEWLITAVEQDRHRENSPIGFYFAKLWYHERLYPLSFLLSALGQAIGQSHPNHTTDEITPKLAGTTRG